jgi:hypothetical protein
MFVQIYTDPACARMHVHFSEEYMMASVERPGVMSAGLTAMAAVA